MCSCSLEIGAVIGVLKRHTTIKGAEISVPLCILQAMKQQLGGQTK